MSAKSFASQRAVLRSSVNGGFFDEVGDCYVDDYYPDYFDSDDEVEDSFVKRSLHGTSRGCSRRAETFELSQFLATTGPEEYTTLSKKSSQQKTRRTSRLIKYLRKQPAINLLNFSSSDNTPSIRDKVISSPIVVCQPSQSSAQQLSSTTKSTQRDSGVYSETSEKYILQPPLQTSHLPKSNSLNDIPSSMPPSIPAKSKARSQPKRPAPLSTAAASAAIAAATGLQASGHQTSTSSPTLSEKSALHSIPAAALNRQSVKKRQTQLLTGGVQPTCHRADMSKPREHSSCQHCAPEHESQDACCEPCPSDLSTGNTTKTESSDTITPTSEESKMLLAMIKRLQLQLEEEQRSRQKLETVISMQQTLHEQEYTVKEKSRWNSDCLWLQDRIALLPE